MRATVNTQGDSGRPGIALALGHRRLELDHTLVMGVVNATPDSFSDGGLWWGAEAAVARGRALVAAGADVVDVGGESTRPGADPVPPEEEQRRVLPVIRALAAGTLEAPPCVVSVDTYHAVTAEAALAAGACIVNDVTGGRAEPELLRVAAHAGAAVVLGHLRGQPRTMQAAIEFTDVVGEVASELREAIDRAAAAGIPRERILVDPGIGFGKTFDQNLALLTHLDRLREACGVPVLVGPSRKAFLGAITGKPAAERDVATAAAVTAAVLAGAQGVRVHDVGLCIDAVRVADALVRGRVKG